MTTSDEQARFDAAVKSRDGFFTTFLVAPYSRYIARWAARRGVTPNQVTWLSLLLGIVAAAAFARGTRLALVAGAVVLQLAFTADCVDGQLARYTGRFSNLGAWLDSTFDRAKEYIVYGGLAIGAVRGGDDGTIWLLAAAALALQTVRHMVIFAYRPEGAPAAGGPALATAVVAASRATDDRSWLRWLKSIAVLPIGERFALISVTAAIAGPRVTFVALLVWGGFALAYQTAGRTLRSLA